MPDFFLVSLNTEGAELAEVQLVLDETVIGRKFLNFAVSLCATAALGAFFNGVFFTV